MAETYFDWAVAPPTSLVVTSGTNELVVTGSGTVISCARLTWTAPADATVTSGGRIEVQYRVSGGTWTTAGIANGSDTTWVVRNVTDGVAYDFRIRSRNGAGDVSDDDGSTWAATVSSYTIIGKSAVPSNVPTIGFQATGTDTAVVAGAISDPDVAYYEYRYGASSTWSAMTLVSRVAVRPNQLIDTWNAPASLAAIPLGTWYFAVKARDTSGNYSATATSTSRTLVVADQLAPPASSITGSNIVASAISASHAAPGTWAGSHLLPSSIAGSHFAPGMQFDPQATFADRLAICSLFAPTFTYQSGYGVSYGMTFHVGGGIIDPRYSGEAVSGSFRAANWLQGALYRTSGTYTVTDVATLVVDSPWSDTSVPITNVWTIYVTSGNCYYGGGATFAGSISAANLSGSNTGDQTTIVGNAGSATKLATARNIAGVSFDGTAHISIPFPNLSSIPTTKAGYGITDMPSYSKGTFSPTVTFATPGDLSVAYTTQTGAYYQIGDVVYIEINLAFTPTFTTASGNFTISALPFTAFRNVSSFSIVRLDGLSSWGSSKTQVTGHTIASTATLIISALGSGQSMTPLAAAQFTSGASVNINLSGTYSTA